MLEGLAAWVINNYLGKYVENLNTDQLSIAILQGAVELENLPLRKDALRHIGLPIEVKAGFIGKVKLKIPISQITSAPWEILVEKLYVVIGPISLSEVDADAEEQAAVDYKLSQLDNLEASWRAENAAAESDYYLSYSSWLGLSMSFATNIVENLQLKIKDVHVRFEDDVTSPGQAYALGVRIDELSAQSCDSSWRPKFVPVATESFKLLGMSGCSVYWDRLSVADLAAGLSLAQLSEVMGLHRSNHEFILSPVNAEAKVKRNRSDMPLRSRQTPRIVCDLSLSSVPLTLNQWQFSEMVRCKKGLEHLSQERTRVRFRPRLRPKEDPIGWWYYAVRTYRGSGFLRVRTWEQARGLAIDNVRYVTIYSRLLATASASAPLSDNDRAVKDRVEWNRDFDTLNSLRQVAMRRIRPEKLNGDKLAGNKQESLSLLASWFPGWWGWQQQQNTPDGSAVPSRPTPNELDDQILDALADTVENNTLLKRDTVFGQFNFTLKKGSLNICQSDNVGLVELEFEDVNLGYESRPRTNSHRFNLTLGAIYLHDRITVDSAFPVLISPQKNDSNSCGGTGPGRSLAFGLAKLLSNSSPSATQVTPEVPLFQLTYEYKPLGSNADNKLVVRSKSLDVVYNPAVVKWIIDFFTGPYFESSLRRAARKGYHAMKMKTKKQLLENWENILQGHPNNRNRWDLELDISAPQIFLVEHFNDKEAVLCVIDFGKLHFTNRPADSVLNHTSSFETTEDDDDEAFQTPCSTPPGSISEDLFMMGSPKSPTKDINLDENLLHCRLYDRYVLDFCDLQILVGRVRDNWKFAHLKGTSALHILDKFNISLQIERRVVYTLDPQFPSLTVSGTLPKLVVHVNEQKVCALKTLTGVISGKGLISPLRSNEGTPLEESKMESSFEASHSDSDNTDFSARLVMLQFCVNQMALEVQSRGRSVAELQVSGVKVSFTKRPFDTSLYLSVHGLLLVDALQNFGQDFELLLASHKHVGMDTVSGSLQDSEPTSPTSPASPEPEPKFLRQGLTSPVAITQAISSLSLASRAKSPIASSPPMITVPQMATELPDSEALITVELLFVSADCPTNSSSKEHLQVANIQFNNLDIIANQETIVELMGFVKRLFPKDVPTRPSPPSPLNQGIDESSIGGGMEGGIRSPGGNENECVTRTQLTFDFHRLNVLLLRAVVGSDGSAQARKIATATMAEAKVHATIGKIVEVEGSLGGLQVLDLSATTHRRILSVGEDTLSVRGHHHSASNHANDPVNRILACMAKEMYSMGNNSAPPPPPSPHHNQAFSLSIKRTPVNNDTDLAEISMRMASVWYTHSPQFLSEVRSCAAEFKQYLSNLARSIGTAATEVAIGLINVRTESLAERLSMGGRLYGSSSDISQTPRRFRSVSYSSEFLDLTRGYNSPAAVDQDSCVTLIKWDVVFASPVVVVPRSNDGTQVAVAHLGSITITNSNDSTISPVSSPWGPPAGPTVQRFSLSISRIGLYTIDIAQRLTSFNNSPELCIVAAEKLYSCGIDGKPVLHDTSVQLSVIRQISSPRNNDILLDSWPSHHSAPQESHDNIQVSGKVITPLKLSLSREQYEQLLDTFDVILSDIGPSTPPLSGPAAGVTLPNSVLADIVEDVEMATGVSTLSLDPALRARMVLQSSPVVPPQRTVADDTSHILALTVSFELPELTMELVADLGVGEKGLVDLSFKELIIQFEKSYNSLINIQVSLRSVTMEDLQQPLDSRYRYLMSSLSSTSARPDTIPSFHSRSCPDFPMPIGGSSALWHYSLPDHLETEHILGVRTNRHKHVLAVENSMEKRRKGSDSTKCPYTPPPSPRGHISPPLYHEDNLVHVNVVYRPSSANHASSAEADRRNWRSVTVDFNSLDVIVNVESWLVVLDFFGISDMEQVKPSHDAPKSSTTTPRNKNDGDMDSETELSVRSLTLLLNRAEYEVGRAAMGRLKARLINPSDGPSHTTASVGSFTLTDLTPVHSTLYRHRFITAGLTLSMEKFNVPEDGDIRQSDLELKMEMTSLVYVHTRRYIEEILAFFRLFPHLRKRIGYSKGNEVMEEDESTISTRVKLKVSAVSPIILLPMSSQSLSVLIVDLGNLRISNELLMSGALGTIGESSDPARDVLLDVMSIELESMDLLTGERKMDAGSSPVGKIIPVGSYFVERKGTSLLREKCHLSVHVERNLMPNLHCVADLSIRGTLSALVAELSLTDYKLISGLLSYNIGESVDDILPQAEVVVPFNPHDDGEVVWTCTSLGLELVDVKVELVHDDGTSLACITFIKSRLLIETYSNRTQDIDLVSEEILITDTRFKDESESTEKTNVFTNILQPIHMVSDTDTVQAQVHHRKRLDFSKFTILLNNMKLMAIFDWWDAVQNFILTKPDYIPSGPNPVAEPLSSQAIDNVPFELKLNITDSEIVILENTAQWDSNAVILKSTTVITYRPLEIDKPVSCNLNHCEMFSCILGMEDETALSIIDPVTVNIDILTKQNDVDRSIYKVLKVQMMHLSLRLSYHDVRMFSQMLTSLPKQTNHARNQGPDKEVTSVKDQIDKLKGLGFRGEDCKEALAVCEGKLDDAALWLTQHAATPPTPHSIASASFTPSASPFSFDSVEVETDCISVCLIDDCRDADVPLLEASVTGLSVNHSLKSSGGSSFGSLVCHYYNRLLSGWEPFIEPWRFSLTWEYTLSFASTKTRLEIHVASSDALNLNLTSSLMELYRSVKDAWTDDYYNPKDPISYRDNGTEAIRGSPPGFRRRSPFVPFALSNDTGSKIWYSTIVNIPDRLPGSKYQNCSIENHLKWILVEPSVVFPFSFNEHGKVRHRDTHKLKSHQVYIRVEGWKPIGPITVDKVGIYFRTAYPDFKASDVDLSPAKVVLEVTLEGTARKLITVRSSLQIYNQLPNTAEIRLDNSHLKKNRSVQMIIVSGEKLSVPMMYTTSSIWVRPVDVGPPLSSSLAFCTRPVEWTQINQPYQCALENMVSQVNKSNSCYRFCVSIKREGYPGVTGAGPWLQPAHTLTLLTPLTISNLLPYELHCSINKDPVRTRIKAGQSAHLHQVDLDGKIELSLHLDNFPQGGSVEIPTTSTSFIGKVKLHDHSHRRLYLQVNASYDALSALRINISAPFWFINKTALPIVFKQEGVATETAGQYEEHEIARMVAPLLFSTSSFSENEVSSSVVARIGSAVHPDGIPQWCSRISLQPGIKMRRLKVCVRDNRPDLVYMIGIEIRPGRGRYRSTRIVTLSALYQIHNKSTFSLQFSQKCFATTISDPGAAATYLTTVPNCSLPFHWPRLDKDQLLCVRLLDVPHCLWSGGFKIDDNNSFHINIRDINGRMYFLRIEIVLQGATYFILTMDAATMPPPIRVDNLSLVSLQFHQVGLSGLSSSVKPQTRLSYAWDEPTGHPILTLTAPGGVSGEYHLSRLGDGPLLTYENFIYIAFTATFMPDHHLPTSPIHSVAGGCGWEELVLDVPDYTTGRVVLSKKQQGARSQLWRMSADGQLQHEGSSPPRASPDKILVLDIIDSAPQPTQYTGLMVRRPDKRRSHTQSWRFTEDGRLCCAHINMCVQAKDGFKGLRGGSEVLLGPPGATSSCRVPPEQAVSRQRLRPGSGCLAVEVTSDGPTRILRITDVKEKSRTLVLPQEDGGWVNISIKGGKSQEMSATPASPLSKKEMALTVELPKVGVSLLSQWPPEELIFITFDGIRYSTLLTPHQEIYDISIQDIQVDNQQLDAQVPVVFFVTPSSRSSDPDEVARPVISISADRKTPNTKTVNADIFKSLTVRMKSISIILEERLALKLLLFLGLHEEEEVENTDESDFETQRILAEAASVHAKRYYFDSLRLFLTQVRLSVITSNKLNNKRILNLKKKLGWTLIRFEDAAIDLQPFVRQYSFESGQFLWNSVLKHYKNEMKWQAGIILGSVDFLGNPLGFMNDVSEGVSGLLLDGNLTALVRNVTHGISNSTAKFTETLGDGLGRVSLDESYEETRQKIRSGAEAGGSSGDHIIAGLRGLGFGLLGGVTSIFKQSYDGAAQDGLPGFISGFGKGIVGTVTKPVVGVLDLASETASALRDSSKSSSRRLPNRKRLPRCVTSPTGFLPMYNQKQSQGQQFLYSINSRNYKELFMAYEVLRSGSDESDLRIVISSTCIRVFSCSHSDPTVVFDRNLNDVVECRPIKEPDLKGRLCYYLELALRADEGKSGPMGLEQLRKPRVRCQNEAIASWVSQQINYVKAQYVERQHTLVDTSESSDE